MSLEWLLKSLLVETSGILPKQASARNSDMILVSIVGLCRAYMFVPFNEQGMAMEVERIWIALEERFTFINHSFDGSALGETSFMCFLCHDNFEVLPWSSNLIGNSEWWIILSFDVHGSGEGSRVEPSDGMCLVSTDEDSSTLDMTFAWRGLVLMTEEVCLSMKFSRNSTCSIIGLCMKRPSAITSRHRSAPMSRPKQKRCKIMPSGKHKSRPACINVENQA